MPICRGGSQSTGGWTIGQGSRPGNLTHRRNGPLQQFHDLVPRIAEHGPVRHHPDDQRPSPKNGVFDPCQPALVELDTDCGRALGPVTHPVSLLKGDRQPRAEHLQDFADMAAVEMVLIDEETRLRDFQKELRWNEAYYLMAKGL